MSVQMIKNSISSQSGGRRTPLSLSGGAGQATSKISNKPDVIDVELNKSNVETIPTKVENNTTVSKKDVEEKKAVMSISPGKSGKTGSKSNNSNDNNNAKNNPEKKNDSPKKSEKAKKQKGEIIEPEKDLKTSNGNKAIDEEKNDVKVDKVATSPKSKKEDSIQIDPCAVTLKQITVEKSKCEKEPEPKIQEEEKPKKENKKTRSTEKTKKEDSTEESSQETIPCKESVALKIIENDNSVAEVEPFAFEKNGKNIGICSTPGKPLQTVDNKTVPTDLNSEEKEKLPSLNTSSLDHRPFYPPTYSSITGRRSVRPMQEYTFTSSSFRESYRKINTELDVTNTSLNVTVGSEIPNCSSLSFLEKSRKRERTPTQSDLDIELISDVGSSPKSPKRLRLDLSGFFGLVASPMTMLRSRFSRSKIQSTPCKSQQDQNNDIDVANFSGIAIEEDNLEFDTKATNNEVTVDYSTENEKETDGADEDVAIKENALEIVQDSDNIVNSDVNIVNDVMMVDDEKLNEKDTSNEIAKEKRRACNVM